MNLNNDLNAYKQTILHALQAGEFATAQHTCEWLLSQTSEGNAAQQIEYFEVLFYLGVSLQFQGNVANALVFFEKALCLNPASIDAIQAVASCYEQLGDYKSAYKKLLSAQLLTPHNADVIANLGVISEKLQNAHDAITYYNQALAINAKCYVALLNRGALLSNTGYRLQALAHAKNAYQIHPQSIGVLYNLVDALLGVFQYNEALDCANIGLKQQPSHANLLFKKGLILCSLQQFEAGLNCMANAQVLLPTVVQNVLPAIKDVQSVISIILNPKALYLDAMHVAQSKCFWRDRAEYVATLRAFNTSGKEKNGDDRYVLQSCIHHFEFAFQALSLPLNPQERLIISRGVAEYVKELAWLKDIAPFIHHTKPRQKLRIGYVSSDFRQHPTGLLSRQIYGLHNKAQFEIYAYSTFNTDYVSTDDGVTLPVDFVRESVIQGCSLFRDVADWSDEAIAAQIQADEIDILVDLNGYTAKAKSIVFALRPAPIQVSYLAYLHSMGSDFIDYAILDHTVCPKASADDWDEKVVRLPNSLYVYDNETSCIPIQKTRAELGLPQDAFVFCCLSTSYKIEPEIFAVWMRILNAVPNAVLWLLGTDELTEANLKAEAAAQAIEPTRIIFAPMMPHKEHLLRYQLADLFIDTYWYGAHTTALDALWQGLPVLCCVGEVSTARVAAAFLRVLDMPSLITHSFTEYEAKAIEIAQNPALLNGLKQTLIQQKVTSPLFNTALTVKHIEQAYLAMWENFQTGNVRTDIDI